MKQTIFKRIFFIYAAVVLLAIIIIELYITRAMRTNAINSLFENLSAQAMLISRNIDFSGAQRQDALARQLRNITNARVTLIATDGRVIGDSDKDSSLMDNHADRPEIRQAAISGTGTSIRYSDTLQYEFLYAATSVVRDNKHEGFVRLSVPLKDIDSSIARLRLKIMAVVIIVLLFTGLISLRQMERIRRFTIEIQDFAASLARGELGKRLFIFRAGEFQEIAASLNLMSSELQRHILEYKEERNRLNVILKNIPDALLISDADGVIRFSSAASEEFFMGAQVVGRRFSEVLRNREFLVLISDVRRTREPGMAEFRLDYPNERHIVARVAPLSFREKEVSGFVAIFNDITRLRTLERIRKDFVANVSHELKTPISAIQGYAETLIEGGLEDKKNARKFIETIKANSERINAIVDDLMTISKIESGILSVKKRDVEFKEAADAVVSLLKGKADERGLALTVTIPPGLGKIRADWDRFIQILTNIVDNAIKFTEKGGVVLGMSEENGKTCVFVEDTGIGIPEKHIPRLGERFYRVDAGRSRTMGGTGLGLAIVKHLVNAHGWDMKIESMVGKGTKVKLFVA